MKSLQKHLCKKYGSIAAAWDAAFAPHADGDGHIEHEEFLHACALDGVSQNLDHLFDNFDWKECGFLTLNDLLPGSEVNAGDSFTAEDPATPRIYLRSPSRKLRKAKTQVMAAMRFDMATKAV